MDRALGEPLRVPRPRMGPNSADLPAVPPVPHERHLPVAAPTNDPQIAVGGQGHVPGAGQKSGCGAAAGHSEGPRSCPRSCRAGGCREGPPRARAQSPGPRRRRCHSDPRRRRSAHARAAREAPPSIRRRRRTRHRAEAPGGQSVSAGPARTLSSTAANSRVAGWNTVVGAACLLSICSKRFAHVDHFRSIYCPSTICQADKFPALLELTF